VSQRKSSDVCIKNPIEDMVGDAVHSKAKRYLMKVQVIMEKYILCPITSAFVTLWNPRKNSRRLILIQLFNYTLYWFTMDEQNILYFYMRGNFPDFDGSDFALYVVVTKV
jgi:hypothetical protein